MWRPWVRFRDVIEESAEERAQAEREKRTAEQRRQAVQKQVDRSRLITTAFSQEIERNGWTELLQKAWGGR